jgi:serine/threonine-protein kinase
MPATRRVLGDRYEIERELAHGGMGDVYLARDNVLARRVAVKILHPDSATDPANIERFRREAQSAAGLAHPNIVKVYDWGQDGDTFYLVMEYVPGETLRELLDRYGRLPVNEAARLAAEIAAALDYADEHGVVHRDVKPGNVLITTGGEAKVTDFGIARADDNDGLTRSGAVLGTATYLSPEQAQGKPLDGRSDVYALGVVLYEMTTGTPPFRAANPVSLAYKHVRESPRAPSSVVPGLPGALDRIVLTAMAKDRDDRYATAGDLRADLLRFERGRPLIGGPVRNAAAVPTAVVATAAAPGVSPSQPAAPRRRDRRALFWIVLASVALVALIGALIATAGIGGSGSATPTAVVPTVVGQAFDSAKATLEKAGFAVAREDVDEPSQPAEQVLAQDPEAGSKLERGGKVTLSVSSATVVVPDLKGKTRDEATTLLHARGITPNFVAQESTQPPGTVLSTDPPAGTRVPKATLTTPAPVVTVNVAREPQVVIPDVTNLDPDAAQTQLTNLGFVVNRVTTPSATVPVGRVVGTNPPANTAVDKGSQVDLQVSSGPETVPVPNVVGQTKAAGEAALLGAGFQVAETPLGTCGSATPPAGCHVTAQNPSSGNLPKGSTVSITVAP